MWGLSHTSFGSHYATDSGHCAWGPCTSYAYITCETHLHPTGLEQHSTQLWSEKWGEEVGCCTKELCCERASNKRESLLFFSGAPMSELLTCSDSIPRHHKEMWQIPLENTQAYRHRRAVVLRGAKVNQALHLNAQAVVHLSLLLLHLQNCCLIISSSTKKTKFWRKIYKRALVRSEELVCDVAQGPRFPPLIPTTCVLSYHRWLALLVLIMNHASPCAKDIRFTE